MNKEKQVHKGSAKRPDNREPHTGTAHWYVSDAGGYDDAAKRRDDGHCGDACIDCVKRRDIAFA